MADFSKDNSEDKSAILNKKLEKLKTYRGSIMKNKLMLIGMCALATLPVSNQIVTAAQETRAVPVECGMSMHEQPLPFGNAYKDALRTLGVSNNASAQQIKAAYRTLATQNHPDVAGSANTVKFQGIRDAYAILTGTKPQFEIPVSEHPMPFYNSLPESSLAQATMKPVMPGYKAPRFSTRTKLGVIVAAGTTAVAATTGYVMSSTTEQAPVQTSSVNQVAPTVPVVTTSLAPTFAPEVSTTPEASKPNAIETFVNAAMKSATPEHLQQIAANISEGKQDELGKAITNLAVEIATPEQKKQIEANLVRLENDKTLFGRTKNRLSDAADTISQTGFSAYNNTFGKQFGHFTNDGAVASTVVVAGVIGGGYLVYKNGYVSKLKKALFGKMTAAPSVAQETPVKLAPRKFIR